MERLTDLGKVYSVTRGVTPKINKQNPKHNPQPPMLYEGVEGIRGKMEDMQKFFSRGIHCASSADMEHFEIL